METYLIFVFPQRVALSFDFPFYGHYLRQIIVATGGEFLIYMTWYRGSTRLLSSSNQESKFLPMH